MTVTRRNIANAFLTLSFIAINHPAGAGKAAVIMKMITYAVLATEGLLKIAGNVSSATDTTLKLKDTLDARSEKIKIASIISALVDLYSYQAILISHDVPTQWNQANWEPFISDFRAVGKYVTKASEVISSYDGQLKINEPQIFEQALEVLAFRKNIEAQVDELQCLPRKKTQTYLPNFYRSTSLFIVL